MENQKFITPVGYSEMYEWAEVPDVVFARFVQFDTRDPEKIIPYKGGVLLGVSTIQSLVTSDDPDEWKYAYLVNEVGDKYLKKEKLAVGIKEYDQLNEISYIHTQPYEHYINVPSSYLNTSTQYTKRTKRREWVRVNLIGKVIVYDNGTCNPGEFCSPYEGKEKIYFGTAVPYDGGKYKFYVTKRFSDKTIEIVNAPLTNTYDIEK